MKKFIGVERKDGLRRRKRRSAIVMLNKVKHLGLSEADSHPEPLKARPFAGAG